MEVLLDPISPISQISRLLKRQLGQQESPGKTKKTETTGSSQTKSTTRATTKQLPKAKLQQQIAQALSKLDEQDQLGKKGVTLLVEHILSWSFGERAARESKMQHAAKEVVETVLKHPNTYEETQQLIKQLIAQHR